MTELKLEFLLEEPEIPAEVDRLLLRFFKGICREIFSGTFRKTLYKKQSVMKTYCWSCYLPGARFAADKIYLKETRFMVTFSDADMENYLNSLMHFS